MEAAEGPLVTARFGHTLRWPRYRGRQSSEGKPSIGTVSTVIASLRRDDDGQGLAEYALILSLIAIVAIIALIFLGTQVSGLLNTVGKSV